jgi:Tol biopolymer transport system component
VKRLCSGLLGLAVVAGLAASCGGSLQSTCGMGAGRPHPEIGGEVLYYCSDWPNVNGGLYLLDVETGGVRALTSDLAWNLDGAWSPDGSRIAFQSTRDGRDDIYVMDLGGGRVKRLTDGRGYNEYPSWSPDGQWILFNSTRDGVPADSGGTGYYRDLYVMRPDGTNIHRLTRHVGTFAFAAWNPDGRALALQSDRAGLWDIYTMGVDGTGLQQRTHHEKTAGSAAFPRWSPDGTSVIFGASMAGEPASIYWLRLGADEPHRVTVGVPGLQWDGFPDWSPDGSWIVFERNGDDAQLYAVRPDGSGLTQLTDGRGFKALPRWRPR